MLVSHDISSLIFIASDSTARNFRHATLACYKTLLNSNPAVSLERCFSWVYPQRWYVHRICIAPAAMGEERVCLATCVSDGANLLWNWRQTKIALRCSSEEELLTLQAQAQSLNLCARSIQDAGRTQIAAGSRTVLGIAGKFYTDLIGKYLYRFM